MSNSVSIDEIDRAIVHAVERSPRASWKTLGAAVGVDAATVARRWMRLEDSGIAWATCYPLLTQDATSALVELKCQTGALQQVAATVARDPQAQFVDIVSGRSDILITAISVGQRALARYVLARLPAIPGVQEVSTQPIISVDFEGGYAAAGSLERSSLALLPTPEHGRLVRSSTPVDDLDWALCVHLSRDARQSVTALSNAIGASESTIKRRLARLTDEGTLRMMVEFAPDVAGNDTLVWLSARIPPPERRRALQEISLIPNVKAIVSTAGPDNLVVKTALRNIAALEGFEARLTDINASLSITDRKVVLQPIRLMSRLVNESGRATEAVSIDVRNIRAE